MPMYSYKCVNCDHVTVKYRTIDKRNDAVSCEKCGEDAKKIYDAAKIGNPRKGYINK